MPLSLPGSASHCDFLQLSSEMPMMNVQQLAEACNLQVLIRFIAQHMTEEGITTEVPSMHMGVAPNWGSWI